MKSAITALALVLLSLPASAIHMYASSSCVSKTLKFNYDGPGSNYAAGGYSHLGLKSEKSPSLSADTDGSPVKSGDLIVESIGDEKVEFLTETLKIQGIGQDKVDQLTGRCNPNVFDYEHTEGRSIRTVKIAAISRAAARRTGLAKGSIVRFACKESSDTPIRCPSTGRWSDAQR